MQLPMLNVPKPKPTDAEDVAWALSTAEAMWNCADPIDAIRWIRRASEAAADAGDDSRALELAKVAADLSNALPTDSHPAIPGVASAADRPSAVGSSPSTPSVGPPYALTQARPSGPAKPLTPGHSFARSQAPMRHTPARGVSKPPTGAPTVAESHPVEMAVQEISSTDVGEASDPTRAYVRPALPRPSSPPPRLPNRAPVVQTQQTQAPTAPPAAAVVPAPAATLTGLPGLPKMQHHDETGNLAEEDDTAVKPVDGKRLQAKLSEKPAGLPVLHDESPSTASGGALERAILRARETSKERHSEPPKYQTGGHRTLEDPIGLQAPPHRGRSTNGDELTRPNQALRVVLYRDSNGVHVAPAGTRVEALSVEAMLVALHPDTDLAAWIRHGKG